jgi:Kef-type K+ transport system membrane component KefB
VAENKHSPGGDVIVSALIVARVLIILVVWLGVFLAIFLGYFTVPILLIGVITVIYLISDLGLFVVLKRRRKLKSERQEFVETMQSNDIEQKE